MTEWHPDDQAHPSTFDFEFGDEDPADAIDATDGTPEPFNADYLGDLADVLRRGGLDVIEVSGWQTRGRSNNSKYHPGRPTHVMWHHTASKTSAENDVNYMTFGSSIAPIANLYFDRLGPVWVMAGGPSNTNGQGQDTWGGGTPKDSMNTHAIGCEIGNNGTGERYTAAQEASILKAGVALSDAYGIPSNQHRAHFEWAPGRKIDPFGPSKWTDYANTFWIMNRLRADVAAAQGEPMNHLIALIKIPGDNRVWAQWQGFKTWVPDPQTLDFLRFVYGEQVQEVNITVFKAAGPVVGPMPPEPRDGWGVPR